MKKHLRLFTSLFLVLCILVSLTAVFAAESDSESEYPQYNTYTCLGDSIAAGFGYFANHNGLTSLGCEQVDIAYHSIVADAVGADLNPLGYSFMSCYDLMTLLDSNYSSLNAYIATSKTFLNNNGGKFSNLASARSYYQNSVKDSDLITVNVGSNDLWSYPILESLGAVSAYVSASSIIDIYNEITSKNYDMNAMLSTYLDFVTSIDQLSIGVTALIKNMTTAYFNYLQNINTVINDIKAINSNATIVLVGLYNPSSELQLTDAEIIPIGRFYDGVVAMTNLYLRMCASLNGCVFAGVMGTDLIDSPSLLETFTTISGVAKFVIGFHPSEAGHKQMADSILEALKSNA